MLPLMATPAQGAVVHCRSHRWLVEEVEAAEHPEGDTVVRLACLDDDANGQRLEVFWQREVDALVLGETTWDTVGQRGFDDPQVFGSYLNTLRWNCVTSTDPGLFQVVFEYTEEPVGRLALELAQAIRGWCAMRPTPGRCATGSAMRVSRRC
ncbi:MAG: hypothetical protein EBR33_05685 [Synechococcaceae bacterium WB4_1_0192]|nr:hypothetical protein [Synechococcaceae bacterium WB4_1_0192]